MKRWTLRDRARIVGWRTMVCFCRGCGKRFTYDFKGAGRPREFCQSPCTRARGFVNEGGNHVHQ